MQTRRRIPSIGSQAHSGISAALWRRRALAAFHVRAARRAQEASRYPYCRRRKQLRRSRKFHWMLQQGVFDILQPEVMLAGGITDVRKIGALAEAFDRQVTALCDRGT